MMCTRNVCHKSSALNLSYWVMLFKATKWKNVSCIMSVQSVISVTLWRKKKMLNKWNLHTMLNLLHTVIHYLPIQPIEWIYLFFIRIWTESAHWSLLMETREKSVLALHSLPRIFSPSIQWSAFVLCSQLTIALCVFFIRAE